LIEGATLRRAPLRVKASGIRPSARCGARATVDNRGIVLAKPGTAMTLHRRLLRLAALGALAAATAARAAAPLDAAQLEALAEQVKAREIAFAQTLADRRLDRFADFVAEDAVFRGSVLRIGRATIVEKWRAYFDGPKAPFSWAPDTVTVAADGRTAISSGPVRDGAGRPTSRYITIWRLDPDQRWRAIVDGGVDTSCDAAAAKP
jgi:ketosteroid isomerase-like protein